MPLDHASPLVLSRSAIGVTWLVASWVLHSSKTKQEKGNVSHVVSESRPFDLVASIVQYKNQKRCPVAYDRGMGESWMSTGRWKLTDKQLHFVVIDTVTNFGRRTQSFVIYFTSQFPSGSS